ncbi:membrane-bound lytic murein transglycosylase D [Pontibacter ummariensis]|uniref:Membrane-bound lytic murein transglycosylase D n=1 Tax=Pontibacter ummariensis TaxID=1610492 RepID=A0A239BCG4_9BACT|nr:LysM peptidoglycan-binding domain-containing protein [Pontibacter ummariensis]PRY16420.1 membrane-bound lytic murein transglycosylase D [Pontibacter ummariensis]SNS04854.1 membrane-bound lytic murein transglycosylase D [Pontibacter ummariensis]
MRKSLTSLFTLLLLPLLAFAQAITVPNNIYFADIHLRISDRAQQEIQKKVDALHRNQTYFKIKVDLADAYFPIIERVFKEEGVPDDYKYLALQESGLIGDAVSTSNAVGYWQFKREAASDFSLRMDHVVDERRHIIEASRAAARYFKRSNNYYNNWFNSLLSYYLGYTGAKSYAKPSDNGGKKMDVTEKSHEYVLTFLAHKIAYDSFVGKASPPATSLREMRATPGQSLADIALATKTDYAELERYNKWLLGNSIPSDKDYYVLVPVRRGNSDGDLLASQTTSSPIASSKARQSASAALVKRNGLNALIAREGDTKDKLALQAGISTRRFLNYNDMHNFDPIVAGSAYYIEKKNTSAEVEYHVVQPGETMQMISQHYGIRLGYLLFKNRMSRSEVPVPGRVLWLQKRRPSTTPVEVRDLSQKQGVASNKTSASPAQESQPADEHKEEAPRENIFTRFINSLKRDRQGELKHQEEEEETAAAAPAPAARTAPNATSTPKETTVVAAKAGAETTEETETAPAARPAPKATKETVLYPDSKTQPSAAQQAQPEQAPAVAQPEKEPAYEDDVWPAVNGNPTSTAKSSTAAGSVPASDTKATTHVVKQGETLYGISRMYAVTINDLVAWNNLGDASLKMGQELVIAAPLKEPEEKEETETPATSSANSSYHTVTAGETLYQISKKYNVTLDDLRTWNSLVDNNIKLGQELRVKAPAGTAAPVKSTETTATPKAGASPANSSAYHTVAGGESMYQISRKYGVTIKDIMEWNNKSDFSVSVGEKLLIRKK